MSFIPASKILSQGSGSSPTFTALSLTSPLTVGNGSNAAPSLSFTSDNTTGVFYDGSLEFTESGVTRVSIDGAGLHMISGGTTRISSVSGTVGIPSFSFNSDIHSGMYLISTSQLGFTTNSSLAFSVNSSQQIDMNSHKIINLLDPTSAQDAASKNYVDNIAAGLNVKSAVRVSTTANLTATASGSGVGKTLTNSGTQVALSIDGVSVSSSDRVLVKNQTTAKDNGIYTVTNIGSGSTNWVLTRAVDFDGSPSNEVQGGDFTFVTAGTVNTATGWVVIATGAIVVDTDAINWTQFTASVSYTADESTIHLSGNTFSVKTGGITDTQVNASAAIALSKLAALSTAKVLVSDGSGFISASSVTTTTLGFLDATSSIQTQINTKSPIASPTFTGVVTTANGTVGTPALTFGDAATGFYRAASNQIGISINGTEQWHINSSGGLVSDNSSLFYIADGAVSTPGISFVNSTGSGLYKIGTNDIGFATGGVKAWEVDSSQNFTMYGTTCGQAKNVNGVLTGYIQNDDNTSDSTIARFTLETGGANAGDPVVRFYNNVTNWSIGLDNSDSDKFKISNNVLLGTSDVLTLDTSGNVFIGNVTGMGSSYKVTIGAPGAGAVNIQGDLSSTRYSITTNSPAFYLQKANGTVSSPTAVIANDSVGDIFMNGHDGTNFKLMANIRGAIDGSVSTNIVPGRLEFYTTTTGGSSTLAMKINSSQQVIGFNTGSVSKPAFAMGNDTTTGISSFSTGGRLDLIVSGSDVVTITTSVFNSGAVFQTPDGTISSPAYQFTNETNTGFYRSATHHLTATVNGGIVWDMANTLIDAGVIIREINGSAGAPSFTFTSDAATGLYLQATGHASIAAAGVETCRFTSGEILPRVQIGHGSAGTAGAPSYSFDAHLDTGMYNPSSADIGFANGGALHFVINSGGIYPGTDNSETNGNASLRWSDLYAVNIHSGDVVMDNDWRITEGYKVGHPEEGIMFLSPTGDKFKIAMTKVD